MQIKIPKWAQMVGLPVILLLAWFTASLFAQAIFIFAAASVIALIIDPLVRRLEWLKIPRFIGVFVVYLTVLAIIIIFFILVIPPVISQLVDLVNNLPSYTQTIRDQFDSWKSGLERLNLPMDVSGEAEKIIARIQTAILDLGSLLVQYSINMVNMITQFFMVIVVSIYMLLDSRRIGRFVRSLFPSDQQADADEFVQRTHRAVSHWVQAQALLSFLIGVSVGVGVWFLGMIGVWPEGGQYAVFFGAWAAVTEFIPYVGPILGAVPPVATALFASPWSALAVVVLFVFIQQVEGHILVPNIMGQVVGIHPLVVIFAVLAGAELRGIAGMLLTLPLLALGREIVIFFKPRISLEKFGSGGDVLTDNPSQPPPTELPAREGT
ncbi:MAG: AI-2E family transporter [Thermoleophilia bacterium]